MSMMFIQIYIYIYIYVCVCVCVVLEKKLTAGKKDLSKQLSN